MPPADLLTPSLAIAAGVGLAAGIMKGYSGFGTGLVTVPIYSVMFGPVNAVAMALLLDSLATAQLLPRALPQCNWRLVGPLIAAAVPTLPLGVHILVTTEPETMRRVIAAAVTFIALVMLSGWRYRGEQRPAASVGVGALAGLVAGGTGMGGPVFVLYILSNREGAARNRASIILLAVMMVSYFFVVMLLNDAIRVETLWRTAVLAPVLIFGAWIGSRLFLGSSDVVFQRIALAFVLAVGITALAV